MNRTRGQFLASSIVTSVIAVLTVAVGLIGLALGKNTALVAALGLLLGLVSCLGFLLAWRAPKE